MEQGEPAPPAPTEPLLYMITANALYTLNTTTGGATRVASVSDFTFQGLASLGGTLYTVSTGNQGHLHTINDKTGASTTISGSAGFGVNEQAPTGLTSHNGTLYMVGTRNRNLYTLNTTTSRATRVGTSTRFGVIENSPSGLASHNGVLYMVGFGNVALYTLNTTTGAATRVGNSTNFGVGEFFPQGLASYGGKLYMIGSGNNALYTLNTTTGVAERVGSATQFNVNERGITGITSHPDMPAPAPTPMPDLFFVDRGLDALFKFVDPTLASLAATQVGSANRFGANEGNPQGMTAHKSKLFMCGSQRDRLYTLSLTDGTGTRVGSQTRFGVNIRNPLALASDQTDLFVFDSDSRGVYKVNDTTSVATLFHTFPSTGHRGIGAGRPSAATVDDEDSTLLYVAFGNQYVSAFRIGDTGLTNVNVFQGGLPYKLVADSGSVQSLVAHRGRLLAIIGKDIYDVKKGESANSVKLGEITRQGGGFPISNPSGMASLEVPE